MVRFQASELLNLLKGVGEQLPTLWHKKATEWHCHVLFNLNSTYIWSFLSRAVCFLYQDTWNKIFFLNLSVSSVLSPFSFHTAATSPSGSPTSATVTVEDTNSELSTEAAGTQAEEQTTRYADKLLDHFSVFYMYKICLIYHGPISVPLITNTGKRRHKNW